MRWGLLAAHCTGEENEAEITILFGLDASELLLGRREVCPILDLKIQPTHNTKWLSKFLLIWL